MAGSVRCHSDHSNTSCQVQLLLLQLLLLLLCVHCHCMGLLPWLQFASTSASA